MDDGILLKQGLCCNNEALENYATAKIICVLKCLFSDSDEIMKAFRMNQVTKQARASSTLPLGWFAVYDMHIII